MTDSELVSLARAAMARAYAPYSGFQVARRCWQRAERSISDAILKIPPIHPPFARSARRLQRLSAGGAGVYSIAIVGGKEGTCSGFCPPCGVCRQVMREFCFDDFRILLGGADGAIRAFTLAQLLPESFSL